jgi:hypothetical protein
MTQLIVELAEAPLDVATVSLHPPHVRPELVDLLARNTSVHLTLTRVSVSRPR